MTARSMMLLLGNCLALSAAGALRAQSPSPDLKIEILVYNYANVAHETLARAEREATRVLDHAGIRIEWLDCPLTPGDAAQYPACQLRPSKTQLTLRVLPRQMADILGLSNTTFGSALLPADGGHARIAQVCAHCAEALAKRHTVRHAVLLGYVMAHELGHLLMGAGSHAPTGLMHVPWQKKELDGIVCGTLLFTSWEEENMRGEVAARSER